MATAVGRSSPLPTPQVRTVAWIGPLLAFLVFYVIALPKGGIKAAGVPLTVGYVLTAAMLVLAMLRGRALAMPLDRVLAFAPCLVLGAWSALVVATNGTTSVGFTISYFVSVLYLPIFGLVFFSSLVLDEHHDRIERAFLWAVRFIVVYGIFLFIFKQTTGRWIEIPFVTVNAADVGQLDDKYINRGGVFKLISTYNNGNIFGVSLAIMAPLYLRLEPRKLLHAALYAAMFLTLSRTVWIAALLIVILRGLSDRVRPLTALTLIVSLLLAGSALYLALGLLGADLSFVFDRRLGGRVSQLNLLNDISLVPDGRTGPLPEIVYLGILKQFGVFGLLLFVAHLLMPSLLLFFQGVRPLSTSRAAACLQGLLVYAVVAGADASYSFIPVMMIFWMIAGLGFWYVRHEGRQGRVRT